MRRVTSWPAGIQPPRKVRVYFRNGHWALQWWEPCQRKNVAERVQGDLIAAVSRAREVERRLTEFRSSGRVGGRVRHRELVDKFVADLQARADAGRVEPRSVDRYRSALTRHYLAYAEQAQVERTWPRPSGVNREFALGLAAFLGTRQVSPNGSAKASNRKMKGTGFVWDVVRAMYLWAADPDRGRLLGDGFRNPFLRGGAGGERKVARDPFGEPDVSVPMAAALLEACDAYQLRLFAPMVFYGLRAAEPAYLFGEYVTDGWLRVSCNPELSYTTKGKRDKRLPLLEPLASVLGAPRPGLLFVRRSVAEGRECPPLLDRSLAELTGEFRRRLTGAAMTGLMPAAQRQRIRDQLLREAGGTSYDRIEGEFTVLATRLAWPAAATLKDLRHLFATSLAAAGMVEPYRQYLMGHAPTSAVIGVYTHLNRVREQYQNAIEKELGPLVEVLWRRANTPRPLVSPPV